jgi:hypothetical protein
VLGDRGLGDRPWLDLADGFGPIGLEDADLLAALGDADPELLERLRDRACHLRARCLSRCAIRAARSSRP